MAKSLSLALYLATKARRDRALGRGGADKPLTDIEKTRDQERRGIASHPRPSGQLIWIHTGRDTQGTAARQFAARLQSEREDIAILLTTSADKRVESKLFGVSQFAPDEDLSAIRKFLAHWQPDISVWSEPDLRPALVTETARCDIPLVMVDANTAQPDTHNWRWWRGMSGAFLSEFQGVLTGSIESAATLKKLGARADAIEIKGYLEEGTPALPCDETERAAMAREIGGRPIWLAAHISNAERPAILAAHRQALRQAHRLLLILVPETPSDGLAWTRELSAEGFPVALRSAGQDPHGQTQVYIADTEQEMGLWYRLAPISFLGQSLVPNGGLNPFEAAALGSAILHGPHVDAHAQAYARLARAKASLMVDDSEALGSGIETLLAPDVAASMAHGAWSVCSTGSEVTDRCMDLILTLLDSRETV